MVLYPMYDSVGRYQVDGPVVLYQVYRACVRLYMRVCVCMLMLRTATQKCKYTVAGLSRPSRKSQGRIWNRGPKGGLGIAAFPERSQLNLFSQL